MHESDAGEHYMGSKAPEKAKAQQSPMDNELRIMGLVTRTLQRQLPDDQARQRVAAWVFARFGGGQAP